MAFANGCVQVTFDFWKGVVEVARKERSRRSSVVGSTPSTPTVGVDPSKSGADLIAAAEKEAAAAGECFVWCC